MTVETRTYYDAVSGEILTTLTGPADNLDDNKVGIPYLLTKGDPLTQYVDVVNEVFITRPTFGYSDRTVSVDTDTIFTGVPVGTLVIHPDGETTVNDGQVNWQCDEAGDYTLIFQKFPCIMEIVNVTVTA